jgi:hypothetical protein
MSRQEQVSWVSLVITIAVAVWYFSIVLQAPAEIDLHGRAMAQLVGKIVTMAIVLGIASELAFKYFSKSAKGSTEKDERDELIDLRATRNGHVTLTIGVAVVLCQIALIETVRRLPARPLEPLANLDVLSALLRGPLSALLVAQLLLMALTLAALCVYISRIVYYRRGY